MTGSGTHHRRWRRGVALAVIAFALTVQFVVPAVQLTKEGSQRWGWQMYSRPASFRSISGVTAQGDEFPVMINTHFFRIRAEITPSPLMIEQLCERERDAVAIRIRDRNRATISEVQCNR
jgi:hypothetical protein